MGMIKQQRPRYLIDGNSYENREEIQAYFRQVSELVKKHNETVERELKLRNTASVKAASRKREYQRPGISYNLAPATKTGQFIDESKFSQYEIVHFEKMDVDNFSQNALKQAKKQKENIHIVNEPYILLTPYKDSVIRQTGFKVRLAKLDKDFPKRLKLETINYAFLKKVNDAKKIRYIQEYPELSENIHNSKDRLFHNDLGYYDSPDDKSVIDFFNKHKTKLPESKPLKGKSEEIVKLLEYLEKNESIKGRHDIRTTYMSKQSRFIQLFAEEILKNAERSLKESTDLIASEKEHYQKAGVVKTLIRELKPLFDRHYRYKKDQKTVNARELRRLLNISAPHFIYQYPILADSKLDSILPCIMGRGNNCESSTEKTLLKQFDEILNTKQAAVGIYS